jgi:hypothetical protein
MQIKLFEFKGKGNVVPTGHCYHIEPIRVIIEEQYPDIYPKVLLFIHYMTCAIAEENPYFNVPENKKIDILKQHLKIEFNPMCPYIQDAINTVLELSETSAERAYYAMANTFDRISEFLRNQTNLTTGRDGNIKDILATAEKFEKIRVGFKNSYSDLKEEQSRGWGDREIAYDQR